MIAQEVLKSESSQELKRLLRGRILTPDDGFMGLQTAHREKMLETSRTADPSEHEANNTETPSFKRGRFKDFRSFKTLLEVISVMKTNYLNLIV